MNIILWKLFAGLYTFYIPNSWFDIGTISPHVVAQIVADLSVRDLGMLI